MLFRVLRGDKVYEVDIRFRNENSGIKEKAQILADIYELPIEYIWEEYGKLYNMNMSELSKWQYVNSIICNRRGTK